MKRSFLTLLILALTMAACTGSNSPTATVTTPTATTSTETFTGTVQVGGVAFNPFTVAQTGTMNVTLTAAGPPPTIWMSVGIGTPSASTCVVTSSNWTPTPAGTTA